MVQFGNFVLQQRNMRHSRLDMVLGTGEPLLSANLYYQRAKCLAKELLNSLKVLVALF